MSRCEIFAIQNVCEVKKSELKTVARKSTNLENQQIFKKIFVREN